MTMTMTITPGGSAVVASDFSIEAMVCPPLPSVHAPQSGAKLDRYAARSIGTLILRNRGRTCRHVRLRTPSAQITAKKRT